MDRRIDRVPATLKQPAKQQAQVLLEQLRTDQKKEQQQTIRASRTDLHNFLFSFDTNKLRELIACFTPEHLSQHPAKVLLAQLSLDLLGLPHTSVDGIVGPGTNKGVREVKKAYGSRAGVQVAPTAQIDTSFFVAVDNLLATDFVYEPEQTADRVSSHRLMKKEGKNTLPDHTEGMITAYAHQPAKFMREVGKGPISPDQVGKIFYLGTKNKKDFRGHTGKNKQHLFWHGSAGGSASTLQTLYKSGDTAYAILENGAIVCFYDEGKGTGALRRNKGNIFGDPKAHSNGIAVEFAAPIQNRTARITKTRRGKQKTRTETYQDTVEPNSEQIQASGVLLAHLQHKHGSLNVGTSGAGRLVGSSCHTDTIGRSDDTLRQLGVGQDYIDLMRTRVVPV